jgi:NADH dehydrogenase/NADH:ubiquinone oxidoreductase subunit G
MDSINNISSVVFLLGVNPRLEASILNSRLRGKVMHNPIDVCVIGSSFDLNMPTSFVSLNLSKGLSIFEGKLEKLSVSLFVSKNPYVLIGENIFDRVQGNVKNITSKLSSIYSSLKTIHLVNNRNSEGASWLFNNHFSSKANKIKDSLSIFINLEENIFTKNILTESEKKIWINTHGSSCATESDIIVPMLTAYESEEKHMNVEHRLQKTQKSVTSSVNSRSLKDIISSIFETSELSFKAASSLMEVSQNPELYSTLKETENSFIDTIQDSNSKILISKYPIKIKIKDFYCTDNLTKNSILMQNCSNETIKESTNF